MRGPIWGKVDISHGWFVFGNVGSMLKLATPVLVTVNDPFLPVKKKMGLVLNLDGKQAGGALAVVEAEAILPIQEKPPLKKEK